MSSFKLAISGKEMGNTTYTIRRWIASKVCDVAGDEATKSFLHHRPGSGTLQQKYNQSTNMWDMMTMITKGIKSLNPEADQATAPALYRHVIVYIRLSHTLTSALRMPQSTESKIGLQLALDSSPDLRLLHEQRRVLKVALESGEEDAWLALLVSTYTFSYAIYWSLTLRAIAFNARGRPASHT